MNKTRVVGPTLPPATSEARPPVSPTSTSHTLPKRSDYHSKDIQPQNSAHASDSGSDPDSSSDSDFGPAPPSRATAAADASHVDDLTHDRAATEEALDATKPQKAERDAWMTMPPTQDDLSARFDPTKLRARKFNSGRGAAASGGGSGGGPSTLWTETPEQKRKRLADEVMGVESKDERNKKRNAPGSIGTIAARQGQEKGNAHNREIEKKIKDHTVILMLCC